MFIYHCSECNYTGRFDFQQSGERGSMGKCPNNCSAKSFKVSEVKSYPFDLDRLCRLIEASEALATAAGRLLTDGRDNGNAVALRDSLIEYKRHRPQG